MPDMKPLDPTTPTVEWFVPPKKRTDRNAINTPWYRRACIAKTSIYFNKFASELLAQYDVQGLALGKLQTRPDALLMRPIAKQAGYLTEGYALHHNTKSTGSSLSLSKALREWLASNGFSQGDYTLTYSEDLRVFVMVPISFSKPTPDVV